MQADSGEKGDGWTDKAISEALHVSLSTVQRVRELFVTEGLEAALDRRRPQSKRLRKLDGRQEAYLIALACGEAPAGHARWTLRLLADALVEREYVASISHETVRQTLKKTNSNRG